MSTSTPLPVSMTCRVADETFPLAWWQWGDPQATRVVACVHGLTRQGRDFDALARHLLEHAAAQGLPPLRIVCPDMPGRGHSGWLADPAHYQVPFYVQAVLQWLGQLQAQAPVERLDWVGTSMGGLIALGLAAVQHTEHWPLAHALQRVVFNDVGPAIAWSAIERIGEYVGDTGHWNSVPEALEALQQRFADFGPHTAQQWDALNRPMLRPHPQGGWRMHYDAALAQAFVGGNEAAFREGEQAAWKLYEALEGTPTLLLRGARSDLLGDAAAQAMTERGPRAQRIDFDGVGHAPALVQPDQLAAVSDFLLGSVAGAR